LILPELLCKFIRCGLNFFKLAKGLESRYGTP
jgi:hypothetical protein